MPVGHQLAATQHDFHQAAGWALVQLAVVQKTAFGEYLSADQDQLIGQCSQFSHVDFIGHHKSFFKTKKSNQAATESIPSPIQ